MSTVCKFNNIVFSCFGTLSVGLPINILAGLKSSIKILSGQGCCCCFFFVVVVVFCCCFLFLFFTLFSSVYNLIAMATVIKP